MSTIKDVAALAGVAPSTVSNVFTKKKYVSPKVTRKVREACEQLNYTPSFLASGMRTQKTSLIGLMLSSAAGGFQEFYHYFIEGATIAAAECGYSVILYYEVTDKEKLRAIFASGRGPIEGAVLLTPRTGDFRFIEMETNNIPYVLVGREFLGGGATFVDVCNDTITYEIVSRLIGEGRRNFVFLNSAEELYISQDRLKGFNRALREAGIPVSRARVESVLAADAAAAAGGGVVYAEENSFDAKEYITEKGIARGNFRDTNGSDGTVEGNEYVAYFKSQYPDDGYPYFDNANFGIFTLEYGANLGAGYLAVDVENTFAVSVSTDAETATAVTGAYAPRFTGYDVLHAETEKQSRDVYYFDVSEYLDPNGGTLYVLLQNGCADCGNGAMLYGMTLGTYAEDTVAFTGTVAGGTIWEGARSALALSLTKSAYEDVASVSVNGESLAQSDYTVSDDALTLSAAYMASLSAGEYTLTAVSDYADTRTFSASFTVTEDTLLSVALESAPNKLTYSPGETLDLTGGVLTVTYEGSGVSQVPMTDAAVTVSATAAQQEEGTQTVTVSYGGMSATFTITVEAQADPGTEGEENGTEDPDGGLPAGAIAGIVIACVVVVAGAVTAVVLIRKKKGGKQ